MRKLREVKRCYYCLNGQAKVRKTYSSILNRYYWNVAICDGHNIAILVDHTPNISKEILYWYCLREGRIVYEQVVCADDVWENYVVYDLNKDKIQSYSDMQKAAEDIVENSANA